MLGKIRLADRQGLLSQPRMNMVQVAAVGVLLQEDQIQEVRREFDRMVEDFSLDEPDDPSGDEGPVSWVMPQDFTPTDAMEVLRTLGQGGTMSFEDLTDG